MRHNHGRLAILLLFWLSTALAEPVTLFTPEGHPVADYDEIVKKLGNKSEVRFGDGTVVKITGDRLGKGNMAYIFKIKYNGAPAALRIAQKGRGDPMLFLNHTIKGYDELLQEKIRVPGRIAFKANQYVIQEFIPVKNRMTLDSYNVTRPRMGAAKRKIMDAALLQFVKQMSIFREIGDIAANQVAWTGKEWVLLDWTLHTRWDFYGRLPDQLRDVMWMNSTTYKIAPFLVPPTSENMLALERLISRAGSNDMISEGFEVINSLLQKHGKKVIIPASTLDLVIDHIGHPGNVIDLRFAGKRAICLMAKYKPELFTADITNKILSSLSRIDKSGSFYVRKDIALHLALSLPDHQAQRKAVELAILQVIDSDPLLAKEMSWRIRVFNFKCSGELTGILSNLQQQ
ncbi:MAG: hypothetical protein A2583_00730 [Bdellovibrionales bacterium RIFOXYD1_FULL_53_11]|nr:MAG: hypothetical protein A2583_00730 [Bdellovibrionales bacterium RIFOXYD1_FULL_53_11]